MKLKRLSRTLHRRLVDRPRPSGQPIGDADAPYMLRWRLMRKNPFLNAFLHSVLRPDEEGALHDHPWPSASLILSGAIVEHFTSGTTEGSRRLAAGDFVVRRPRFAHRLTPCLDTGGETWTLFLTGPKLREWGFHCAGGWRHWEEFTAEGPDGRRRGCD